MKHTGINDPFHIRLFRSSNHITMLPATLAHFECRNQQQNVDTLQCTVKGFRLFVVGLPCLYTQDGCFLYRTTEGNKVVRQYFRVDLTYCKAAWLSLSVRDSNFHIFNSL